MGNFFPVHFFMLKEKLYNEFINSSKIDLTKSQAEALRSLAEFILYQKESFFILKGYAGTGKTTLISIINSVINSFGINTVLLAPTGRASKILSSITHKPAYTIHKYIYRKNTSKGFEGRFTLNFNKLKNTIFIVDEASMINTEKKSENYIFGSGSLLDDFIEFVFNSYENKIIFVGDNAQLPPVQQEKSPALSEDFLSKYGYPVSSFELLDITRQAKKSDIIKNATIIREILTNKRNISELKFEASNEVVLPEPNEVWEYIENSFYNCGKEETAIITVSNKIANAYNSTIRRKIFDYDEEITTGDILMVVRNNYLWTHQNAPFSFLANGDFLKINNIYGFENKYGFKFADVNVSLLYYPEFSFDVKLLLNTIYANSPALTYEERRKLYEEIASEFNTKNKKKIYEKLMENEYFNALEVKFAYAFTCHKAQGGQWENVFIDQGHFNFITPDNNYLRWIYTAITRAKNKLYLINFSENFKKE